jgi:hypothetical protein
MDRQQRADLDNWITGESMLLVCEYDPTMEIDMLVQWCARHHGRTVTTGTALPAFISVAAHDAINNDLDGFAGRVAAYYDQHILCAAHTDPYILEQAYEQDEAGLEEQPIDCTGDPLDDDECCLFCGPQFFHDNPECPKYDPRYDEPTIAGEVTGYDNGPTFW